MDKSGKIEGINSKIDHTLLKSDASLEQIQTLCDEAKTHQFKAVCVPPYYVKFCANYLLKSNVSIATVVGFPQGYSCTESKRIETQQAITDGANEIDMVINVAALKNGETKIVEQEIESLFNLCEKHQSILKVIIEATLLTTDEKVTILKICNQIGVHFVKTSTGFQGGAQLKDIRLMREKLDKKIKIKASGGIKTAKFAKELIAAGADRIGASSSLQLIR